MAWEKGVRYRARGVRGEFQITKNRNGTQYVEGLVEVTLGVMQGQRLRFRGYLNTDTNREITAGELRAMGWKGERWGDMAGIGTKEITFTCLADESVDEMGKARTYLRAGFVRELDTLDKRKALSMGELDELPPPPPAPGASNGRSVPVPGSVQDDPDTAFP